MTEKTKLTGGPEKTVTWIWLDAVSGQLRVEFYDFSETAQQMFGNDIAYTLTVTEMKKIYLLTKQHERSLIKWMKKNFQDYFAIKDWLEKHDIAFETEIESWA